MATITTDVLVIGSGLAGCAAAITASRQGIKVIVLTKEGQIEESNTWYAQGGIIFRGVEDSAEKLADDIFAAGAGICNPMAVRILAQEGPRQVKELLIDDIGVDFDRNRENPDQLDLTSEAAHSVPRIIHARDATGRSIESAMAKALQREANITLLTRQTVVDLLSLSHHSKNPADIYPTPTCVGAYVLDQKTGEINTIMAKETILATGGLGRIFLHTSNPVSARGDGIAMAYRAGARCIHLQYVQFHPTTLYHEGDRFLISESMRGEGARLIDVAGHEFMTRYHPSGSLAPRDIVARGIHQMMLETASSCAYLDVTHRPSDWIRNRFPRIYEQCLNSGIDITKQPIPVVPAAHYSCGGVAVDDRGKTSMLRLRAVGEVSCTGVHGANRLASTSLLECLVWGVRAGEGAAHSIRTQDDYYMPDISPWEYEHEPVDPAWIAQDWLTIRQTMWNYVGLVRSKKRLDRAHEILRELHLEIGRFYARSEISDALVGLRNGAQTALVVLLAAMEARQSYGCHYRRD